jgi:transcription initiation factor TFIID subunit 4
MRTTAANVAARAAVGGDDILSKWQLMAEQARQKREGGMEGASGSQPVKDVNRKPLSPSGRNMMENLEAEKRSHVVPSSASGKCDNSRDTCWSKLSFRNHIMYYGVHYICLVFNLTIFPLTGAGRKCGRNQAIVPQTKVVRTISVKDVMSVLEREPQMSRSTLIYQLYERIRSDATAE